MTSSLRREDAFGASADDVYEALIEAHAGLSDDDSAALNARLVLLLANHIGDLGVIREALEAVRTVPTVTSRLRSAGDESERR